MLGLIDKLRRRRKANAKGSGNTARERLQLILVQDRVNLPPEHLAAMKKEILEVVAKYIAIDITAVDIALEQRDRNSLLVAEIPFAEQILKTTADDQAYQGLSEITEGAGESGAKNESDD